VNITYTRGTTQIAG